MQRQGRSFPRVLAAIAIKESSHPLAQNSFETGEFGLMECAGDQQ